MMKNDATIPPQPAESDFNKLFYDSRLEKLARQLRKSAEFNLFEILQYSDYEIRHSNVIAWLLNPSQSHGLGHLFLTEFLKKTPQSKSALQRLSVASDIFIEREKNNFDILVTSKEARVLILIENKFWASEDLEQLKTYRTLVEQDYGTGYDTKMYILLSPSKAKAKDPNWVGVSYRDVYDILERFMKESLIKNARAEEFASQYLELLAKSLIKDKEVDDISEQLAKDHKAVIEYIGAEHERNSKFIVGFKDCPTELTAAVKHLVQLKGKYSEILDCYFWDELLDELGLVKVGKKNSGYFMTTNLHDLFKNIYKSYSPGDKSLHDSLLLFFYDTWHNFFSLYLYLYPGKKEPVRDKLVELIKKNRSIFNIYKRESGYYRIYEYLILSETDYSSLNIAELKKKLKDGFSRFLEVEAARIEKFLQGNLIVQ